MARTPRLVLPTLLLLPLLALAARAADPAKALPERYQKWLKEDVVWILTEAERKEFLALGSDEERDRFMAHFWEIRDPQPLTPENEFRDEHHRRLEYANRNLGNDAPRKGCLTARGRVYILLGKPDDIERVNSANEVYPYEMWFYGRNTARLGLPGQLRLLFYRPFGSGEYRLLDPALDRDRMFPPSTQIDINDYEKVRELVGLEVAQALESVAPGARGSLSSEVISELSMPRKIPERIYEQGVLLHPNVRTRVNLVSLELPLATMLVAQPDGSARVHVGAVLPPAEVSFQEVEGGKFTCRVDVFGDIRDARGVVVAKFDEASTLTLTREELERRRGHAFLFQATRTLVAGKYRLSLIMQDYAKGRLGRGESDLVIPAASGAGPRLTGFTLASRVERAAEGKGEAPFTALGFQSLVPPDGRFQKGRNLYVFAVLAEAAGAAPADLDVEVQLKRGEEPAFSATARSPAASSAQGRRPILVAVPTTGLSPGGHALTLRIKQGAAVLASSEARAEIVEGGLPDGYFAYAERRELLPEVEQYNRGVLLLSAGKLPEAEAAFRLALQHRKGFRPAAVYLARTLILRGKPGEAEPLLGKVLADDPDDHDALLTQASLLLGRNEFAAARASLERALLTGPRSKEVLNALGETAIGLAEPERARAWFEESLRLDPKQEQVARRLESLGG